ncbi:MAG: hypothetical protein OXH79_12890 [Boseongicola sp.]|nr:hypothetical protein [Boseongicola sp.]
MSNKSKQRETGLPADYKGATPEQVARAMRLPRPKQKKARKTREDHRAVNLQV